MGEVNDVPGRVATVAMGVIRFGVAAMAVEGGDAG